MAHIIATPTGCYEVATAPDVIERLEAFLEIIEECRTGHLRRNRHLDTDTIFDDKNHAADPQ